MNKLKEAEREKDTHTQSLSEMFSKIHELEKARDDERRGKEYAYSQFEEQSRSLRNLEMCVSEERERREEVCMCLYICIVYV